MTRMSDRLRSRVRLNLFLALGLLGSAAMSAQGRTRGYPVSLEVLAPSTHSGRIPTVTWGGWPLVLRMTANGEIGMGNGGVGNAGDLAPFPLYLESGYIVFEEPDACHSWLADGGSDECEGFPVNETYLAFRTGSSGNAPGRVASLVLLADTGEGQGGVNLADRITTVGYELDDVSHRTNVIASMVVGNGLVTPAVVSDLCVGSNPEFPGLCLPHGSLALIGGAIMSTDALLDLLNGNNVTTLRAFVVNREAPPQLSDLDADGSIGAKDAELAGFRLLSREVVFRVRTLHQFEELLLTPHADLDGNGQVICDGCGPGGGGLKPVPR